MLTLACAMVISTGMAGAAPTPRDRRKYPLYLPTQKGAKWIYTGPDGKDVVAVLGQVEAKDGKAVVTVAWLGPVTRGGRMEKFEVSADGLLHTHTYKNVGLARMDPPVWSLKAGARAGEEWLGRSEGPLPTTNAAREPTRVKVPAGE